MFRIEAIVPYPWHPGYTYSPAVRIGNTVYLSGTTATDEQGNLVGPGDIEAQARQIYRKFDLIMRSVGGSLRDIVETTDYVLSLDEYRKTARVRREVFGDPWPAATGVVVAGLIRPDALVALGFVLIYKGTGVVHFGYGEQLTFGAYMALIGQSLLGLPFGLALLFALAASALLGWLIFGLFAGPLRHATLWTRIIATLAIGIALREGLRAYMGPTAWPFPFLLSQQAFEVGGVYLVPANLAIAGIAVLILAALFLFLERTLRGKAILSACENRTGASLVGIRVSRVYLTIWILASLLAAVAGILIAPQLTLSPDMGIIAIKGFTAAVIGGFASLPGAVLGGLAYRYLPEYQLYQVSLIAATAIIVLGLVVVCGIAGQISLGQAAFVALGGYGAAILATLRVSGHYLALATMAVTAIVQLAVINLDDLTGGAAGMPMPPLEIAGHVLDNGASLYLVIVPVFALSYALVRNLMRSRIGRAFGAVRQGEIAAAAMGVNVLHYKASAFAASGFLGALGGGLLGALIGSAIFVFIPEVLQGLQSYLGLVFALLLLAFIMLRPAGLASFIVRARPAPAALSTVPGEARK